MINKYRSWNAECKQFFYFLDGLYYDDEKCIQYVLPTEQYRFSWKNAEQLIELNDINGKYPYKGDIVRVDAGYGGDNRYDEAIAIVEFVIDFDEAYYNLNNILCEYGSVMQDFTWKNDVEIIGNIHTDPELLIVYSK